LPSSSVRKSFMPFFYRSMAIKGRGGHEEINDYIRGDSSWAASDSQPRSC
jgi:hypothetical protein